MFLIDLIFSLWSYLLCTFKGILFKLCCVPLGYTCIVHIKMQQAHHKSFVIHFRLLIKKITQLILNISPSLSPIRRRCAPGFVNYKKCTRLAADKVIKFTSCLPMVGGSLRVLRLLPPLKLVAMI